MIPEPRPSVPAALATRDEQEITAIRDKVKVAYMAFAERRASAVIENGEREAVDRAMSSTLAIIEDLDRIVLERKTRGEKA